MLPQRKTKCPHPASLELYNLLGQRVATWLGVSDRGQGLRLESLPEGWYVYRLRSEGAEVQVGRVQLVD